MLCTVKSWVKKLGFGLVINYWQRIKIRVAEFFSMLVSVVGFLDLTQMLGENYPRIKRRSHCCENDNYNGNENETKSEISPLPVTFDRINVTR